MAMCEFRLYDSSKVVQSLFGYRTLTRIIKILSSEKYCCLIMTNPK